MTDEELNALINQAKEEPEYRGDLEDETVVGGRRSAPPPDRGMVKPWTQERRDNMRKKYDEQFAEDPTESMSAGGKFAAGMGSGFMNVWNNVSNMMGIQSDEELAQFKKEQAPLSDTGWGSGGQFIGETAGLAPLGFFGKSAQIVHKTAKAVNQGRRKAKKVAKGLEMATGKTGKVVGEGAGAGAILSDPNERGGGAMMGGAANWGLGKVFDGAGRLLVKGLGQKSESGVRLQKALREGLGKDADDVADTFMPVSQVVGGKDDSVSSLAKSWMDFVGLMPKARTKMTAQSERAMDDIYELTLKRAYNDGPKRDRVLKVFKETKDIQKALDAGIAMDPKGKLSPTQQVIYDAASGETKGRFAPRKIVRIAEKAQEDAGKLKSNAPQRQLANDAADVTQYPVSSSSVESRMKYHEYSKEAQQKLGIISRLVGGGLDTIPLLANTLSSEPVQNFILGNTFWQEYIKQVVKSGSGEKAAMFTQHLQRAMAAQAPNTDDSSKWAKNPQSYVESATEIPGKAADLATEAGRKIKSLVTEEE